ncbi:MAG: sigma-54 interaction domain-containing protein, partial [Acidimicrobiia bacterium]
VAQALHQQSPRCTQPFLAINCSAFQDQLLESELFGHERGSFTGAVAAKPGLFEVADRGTFLLDEVAEMSPAMQAKLLQVLDAGELRRVGGTRTHRVNVRVLAATNKDPAQEVSAGRFREDLYYRLNVINVTLPSLRDRQEDIPILIEHFLAKFRLPGQKMKVVAPEVLEQFVHYRWPGNIRELANTIERLVILSPGAVIGPGDVPENIGVLGAQSVAKAEPSGLALAAVERCHIMKVLEWTQGNKAEAARILGIHLKTLHRKLMAYRVSP